LSIGSVVCSSSSLIIKFFGSPTTDGICDERNHDGEGDQTNDGKDTGDGPFVGEKPVYEMS
jgi:hypothetical protein